MGKRFAESTLGRAFVTLVVMSVAGGVSAAEIDAGFRTSYGWTDNAGRSSTTTIEERLITAGFDLDVSEQTRKFEFALRSSFDFLHYADDTFDDELAGGAAASLLYWLVDERLNWIVEENYGQQLADPFAAETPANRESLNFFTTGPSFLLPIGERNQFGLEMRYSQMDYEITPIDNDRVSARLSFDHTVNEYSVFSVNVRGREVEFDDSDVVDDYEVQEYFVRYEINSPRNTLTADLGWATADSAGEEQEGYMFMLEWQRTLTPRTSVTFTGGSRYADEGDLFRDLQNSDDNVGRTVDVDGEDEPFRNHFIGARYDIEATRTNVVIDFSWNQDDFKFGSPLDRNVVRAELAVERELSRSFSASMFVDLYSRDYQVIDRKDDDVAFGFSLDYEIGQSWSAALIGQYFDRNSTSPDANYTEKRAFIRFTYTPDWGRRTTR